MNYSNCILGDLKLPDVSRQNIRKKIFEIYYNPKTLAPIKMDGDHTTAFVVFKHMFKNRSQKKLGDLLNTENDVMTDIKGLPGYDLYKEAKKKSAEAFPNETPLPPKYVGYLEADERRIEELRNKALDLVKDSKADPEQINKVIGEYIYAIVEFRNKLPYSAKAFGSTGHGEGNAAEKLFNLNVNAARSRIQKPSNDYNSLLDSSVTLLDVNRIKQSLNGTLERYEAATLEAATLEELKSDWGEMPGMPYLPKLKEDGVSTEEIKRMIKNVEEDIINQHLKSLQTAYPELKNIISGSEFKEDFQYKYDSIEE